jgi:hypothetical protein
VRWRLDVTHARRRDAASRLRMSATASRIPARAHQPRQPSQRHAYASAVRPVSSRADSPPCRAARLTCRHLPTVGGRGAHHRGRRRWWTRRGGGGRARRRRCTSACTHAGRACRRPG